MEYPEAYLKAVGKEFNLSDWESDIKGMYHVEHIKMFVKRINQLDSDLRNNRITWQTFLDKRRKLAGDKLI